MSSNIYIPPEQRDARYPIWHVLYRCRVPYGATFSVDQLRRFGYPTSGDRARDQQQINVNEDRMLTIDQMFEYWRAGVTVSLVTYSDSEKVYNAITAYLEHWKRELLNMIDASRAPTSDLIQLDEYASVVYDKAKHCFTKADVDSILARRMTSLLRFGKGNILIDKPTEKAQAEAEKEDVDPHPPRQDNIEFFETFLPKDI